MITTCRSLLIVLIAPLVVLAQAPVAAPIPSGLRQPEVDEQRISIEELQNLAISVHPELSKLQYKVRSAQGGWIQSGLGPNPELNVDLIELGNEHKWGQQEVGISQEIVTNGKIRHSQRVAKTEWDISQKQLAAESLSLTCMVKIRAYELLAAQKYVALQQQLLKLREESAQTAEKMHEVKEVSLVDVVQARTSRNETNLTLNKSINDEALCWRRLTMALGIPDYPRHQISDPLEEADGEIQWETAWSNLLALNPDLQLAKNNVVLAGAVMQREKAERKPNFTVGALMGYDTRSNNSYGTVGVAVPLQIRNRNQGNILRSTADLSAANSEVEAVKLRLKERLSAVYNQYVNAKQSVDTYRQTILPDTKMNLDLSTKGYKQGEFSYLELLHIQQNYIESQQLYIQNLRDLAVSKAVIDGLLTVDLNQ